MKPRIVPRTPTSDSHQSCDGTRDEIARLKGLKGRPQIKPSGMEKATQPEAKGHRKIGRRGAKRAKLTITETKVVKAESLPAGARLKGYEDFIVQDLIVQSKTVLLRRERWRLPTGETVVAPLPAGIIGHFGPELRRFVLAQYHHCQTTMPRLLALLADLGVSISKRQLVRLLIDDQGAFLDVMAEPCCAWTRAMCCAQALTQRHGSRSTIPARGTRRRMAYARRSATTSSRHSRPRAQRAD